jgi:hypothetical protein
MSVVFPLPKKPVIMVTGIGDMLMDLGNCAIFVGLDRANM